MVVSRTLRRFFPAAIAALGIAALAPAAGFHGPERVSIADGGGATDGDSKEAAVTSNGRYVAFYSNATNLFSGATSGYQVVVRDRKSGANLLVSRTSGGAGGNGDSSTPSISDNGRYVVFQSDATDLVTPDANGKVDVFFADTKTGEDLRLSEATGGGAANNYSYAYGSTISM